ncbi:38033_t:CDS:2, partial [Gigaspora margarita]
KHKTFEQYTIIVIKEGLKPAKNEILAGSYKALEAACMVWRMKVETFMAQNKAPKCKNPKKDISKEDLDSASRSWISRVKNIKSVILKKEQTKCADILPNNMIDRIHNKSMELKLYDERYLKINIVNKVVEELEKPSIKE